MSAWIYPVRGVQVVFGIIVLGLTAYGTLTLYGVHCACTRLIQVSG